MYLQKEKIIIQDKDLSAYGFTVGRNTLSMASGLFYFK